MSTTLTPPIRSPHPAPLPCPPGAIGGRRVSARPSPPERLVIAALWGALRCRGYHFLSVRFREGGRYRPRAALGEVFYAVPGDPVERLLAWEGGTIDDLLRAVAALPALPFPGESGPADPWFVA